MTFENYKTIVEDMRPLTWQWKEYSVLRDEALKTIPDNVAFFKIKQEVQALVASKRRFERISTMRLLLQVRISGKTTKI